MSVIVIMHMHLACNCPLRQSTEYKHHTCAWFHLRVKPCFFFATVGFVLKMGFLVIVFDVNSQTFDAIFSTVPVCICSDTEGWPQSHMFVMG